jgi:addiction module RelE/StbE family toxin
MGRIRYAADAVADLAALRSYIEQENPAAATRVAARIVETVSSLGRQPRLGKSGRVSGTRELVIAKYPYIICYEEQDGDCLILRVLHQAIRWP